MCMLHSSNTYAVHHLDFLACTTAFFMRSDGIEEKNWRKKCNVFRDALQQQQLALEAGCMQNRLGSQRTVGRILEI